MNKKKLIFLLSGLVIVGGLVWASDYFAWFHTVPTESHLAETRPSSAASSFPSSVEYKVEVVASNLYVPWSMVFTSPDRLLVSERNGSLRVIEKGKLLDKALGRFEVSHTGEEGLMGLALDPDYDSNYLVYACLAYDAGQNLQDKVISFTDNGTSITEKSILIDHIPSAKNHAGCRLLFLPDKTLLISTGDATEKNNAQKLDSVSGKILRLNRDGSIPSDNPFPNSPVWTYGHRNTQGLAWDSAHNLVWATEHGPSIFDGPAGGDEVNLIEKGKNYGWPVIHHRATHEGMVSPLLEFTPALAPSGLLYYTGTTFPQFTGKLLMATLKGEALYELEINSQNPHTLAGYKKLPNITAGRLREVIQAPDGTIYFTTSNRDGRGKLQKNDDKIYRLVPKDK